MAPFLSRLAARFGGTKTAQAYQGIQGSVVRKGGWSLLLQYKGVELSIVVLFLALGNELFYPGISLFILFS